jgi:hypothetical protein
MPIIFLLYEFQTLRYQIWKTLSLDVIENESEKDKYLDLLSTEKRQLTDFYQI